MKLSQQTKARYLVRLIHQMFEDQRKGSTAVRVRSSVALQIIKDRYPHASTPTILKAKKALGIQSRKVAGHFCWFYPAIRYKDENKRLDCLEAALNKWEINPRGSKARAFIVHKKEDYRKKKIGEAIQWLSEVFKDLKYRVYSKEAISAFNEGKSTAYIYPAKRELGVKTIVHPDGKRYWVWSDETVQDWLTDHLEKWVPIDDLANLSQRTMGWHLDVLYHAFNKVNCQLYDESGKPLGKMSVIRTKRIAGRTCWRLSMAGINKGGSDESSIEEIIL